jgi:betaine lipid synthase
MVGTLNLNLTSDLLLSFFSQGHLLELKLAAIQCLSYEDFFALFGKGHHPHFRSLLDSKIAPLLSSIAYQFWRINQDAFSSSFYHRGYCGWALRLASIIFKFAGVSKDVVALCNSDTIAEQETIWRQKLRPVLLNPVVIMLLKNPIFCWNALGVPLNQRRMLLDEGTVFEFVRDTLDSLASTYSFKNGAYFYLLVGAVNTFHQPIINYGLFRLYWDTTRRLRAQPT